MSKRQHSGHLSVPPRWLHCPRKGSLIADKFIPFKTPLDHRYDDEVPDECKFNLQMFLESVKAVYKRKVGLVVDLTNTTRFYNKDELQSHDCVYFKLQCIGRGGTPDPEQKTLFLEVVHKFIRSKPLELVGVHCTHGFNRTGFLISSYLVELQDWSIDAAVQTFSKARPPGIYKDSYLRELFKIYEADDSLAPPAPPLPDWCIEEEDANLDDDGNALDETDSTKKRRRAEPIKANPTFMAGVGGATPVQDPELLSAIQHKVQDMCGWSKVGFPGSQPVSMDVNNIKLLGTKRYYVSWKADGTRYMMFIDGPQAIYLIDRDNCVFHVPNLDFPKRKNLQSHITNTLLDGELVIDEDKQNRRKVPRYLIYDIIVFEGQEVGKTAFPTRLTCIEKEIYGPRANKQQQGLLDRSREPFGIRPKPFYDLSRESRIANIQKLLSRQFCETLGHETDGLVFQPAAPEDVYTAGRQDDVLKWKPPHLNSVDFKLSIERFTQVGMLPETKGLLYVGGFDRPIDQIKVTKDLHQYNNKIIECSYDMTKRGWKFLRERTDKSFPNAYNTAVAVIESIKHPITEKTLLGFVNKSGWRPEGASNSQGHNSSAGSSSSHGPPIQKSSHTPPVPTANWS